MYSFLRDPLKGGSGMNERPSTGKEVKLTKGGDF